MITEIIGYFASIFAISMFAPQVIKSWKTKQTKALSTFSFILVCLNGFSWIIYGILIRSTPVIFSNSVIFVLAITVLILKKKYG